jgi:glutaredoxin
MVQTYLSERGVDYESRDVSVDPAAVQDLVYKYGSRSTPTLVIGDEVMIGFDPERLDQILAG